ncbi:MAG: glutamate-5-semialdehyde dehydrogenase, partial [Alphaproteobacteria bacterium]|nr:glutamate-5-semialdehyde dehydrogenase [Alphaproteobacteria bacterium]
MLTPPDPATLLIADMGARARAAALVLAQTPTTQKAAALRAGAAAIRASAAEILAASAMDVAAGEKNGLSGAMLDRLRVDAARLEGIAASVEDVTALPDPVGQVIDQSERPNGLKLSRVRVPLGVIGIIYESRPNVTVDAGVLALMSGNAAILRGGSEAINTSQALHKALVAGITSVGLPADAIQLVQDTDRAIVGAMLKAAGLIDIIVPRGGKTLVARVQDEARVPVLAHLDGICHTYIDRAADPEKAVKLAVNAKMRRTGICGATETLLIDTAYADPKPILSALIETG